MVLGAEVGLPQGRALREDLPQSPRQVGKSRRICGADVGHGPSPHGMSTEEIMALTRGN